MTPQSEFRIYMKAAASQPAKVISRHLSEAEMIALYQGTLTAAATEAGNTHITQCSECLQLWRDVRDFLAPATTEEPEAGEFELRREWKDLWGRIQADQQTVVKPAATKTGRSSFLPRPALSLAAGLLLTVSLGAVTLFWRQERRDRLQTQQTTARLETAQQELLARIRQLEQSGNAQFQLSEQLKQEQEKRLELETRLAELNQPQTSLPTYELMLARNERGNAPANQPTYDISVPASAKSYLLRISPEGAENFSAYGIELFDNQNRMVWKSERLRPENESLSVTFPRGYLNEGKYRLRLTGWKGKASTRIGEYNLNLGFSRQ